jgi:hypothetical protein
MVFQLSSSSEINILDLGWVASIRTMFSQKNAKGPWHELCDHVHRDIYQQGSFEVTLVQWTVPTHHFKVQVTKEVNQTYFSVPAWREFIQCYEMEPG